MSCLGNDSPAKGAFLSGAVARDVPGFWGAAGTGGVRDPLEKVARRRGKTNPDKAHKSRSSAVGPERRQSALRCLIDVGNGTQYAAST